MLDRQSPNTGGLGITQSIYGGVPIVNKKRNDGKEITDAIAARQIKRRELI